jgi:large subunit ribosomal protein L24
MVRVATAPRAMRVPDIRKGDEVLVLTGKDAGKRGTVERIERPGRVVIEGINIAKRHTKPRARQGRTDRQPKVQQGGIIDIARPIQSSNVMLVCPNCHMPTRMRHEKAADGRSVRTCSRCGETVTRVEGTK